MRERRGENYGGVVGHEYALGYCFFSSKEWFWAVGA